MKNYFALLAAVIFFAAGLTGQVQNTVTIDASQAKYRINRNIYGHFSEHLGHCIYEGLWVGENSLIPNSNGLRTDVVEALKNIKIPALR